VPQALLTESITRLDADRLQAICQAVNGTLASRRLMTSQRSVAEDIVGSPTSS
jgi:hypothetical protein